MRGHVRMAPLLVASLITLAIPAFSGPHSSDGSDISGSATTPLTDGAEATGVARRGTAIQITDPPPPSPWPIDLGDAANLDAAAARALPQGNRSVAVFRDGELIGFTSNALVRQRGASVSMIITAAAVFALVDKGRLSLSERLGTVLDLAALGVSPAPENADILVADLLGHTSGLPADRAAWFGGGYWSCEAAARVALARPNGGIGRYTYSNTNFCLLSLILAARTGVSYQQAVRDLVFTPLGIDAEYDPRYTRLEGAGAWRISALDLGLLVDALDPDGLGPNVLLSAASREMMTAARTPNYGLGVWRWDSSAWGHSGTLDAARNIVVRLPSGHTVAVMLQANNPASGLDLYRTAQAIAAGL
jgi:CubicO group peptidase (beta-lactamase class C family)